MKFSIIVPSFNQKKFIAETFLNIRLLEKLANQNGHEIEALLFDNCSVEPVQRIISYNRDLFHYIEIKKDMGQYDAINKGICKLRGDYWTWLNTDDLIDVDGFLKLASILTQSPDPIDYIYGGIQIINEESQNVRIADARELNLSRLVNYTPGIYQPGSFFRKSFTDKIGGVEEYRCCFDYEYVLRILKHKGNLYRCDFIVAKFRHHKLSKSGSIIPIFIKEQLEISRKYNGRKISYLMIISYFRLIKQFLVNAITPSF